MNSNGALHYADLFAMTIPEAVSTVRALGYILQERARLAQAEIDRAMRWSRPR